MSAVPYRPRRIIVVELDENMPRRKPDLPHLYVANTVDEPENRLKQLMAGMGPDYAKNRFVCLWSDLNPDNSPATDEGMAVQRLRKLKQELTRAGYAINGIAPVWHTYVVDLDPTGMTDVGKGYVYVGQTSHTPEERYAIHKGEKPKPPARDLRSRVVNRRGLGLNYELMNQLTPTSPVYTQSDVSRLEKA